MNQTIPSGRRLLDRPVKPGDDGPWGRRSEAGFTLIEVVVALAIVAVSLVAIGSLVAANARSTRAIDDRLSLLETTRSVLTGLPDRDKLVPGNQRGAVADYTWRVDVLPFTAPFVDPGAASPWVPQSVVIRVQSPSGQVMRLDTIRLRRAAAGMEAGKR